MFIEDFLILFPFITFNKFLFLCGYTFLLPGPLKMNKQMDLRTSNYAIEPSLDYCACYEGLYTVTCTLYCACTPALCVAARGCLGSPLDGLARTCVPPTRRGARFTRGRLANIPRSVFGYMFIVALCGCVYWCV